jgi:hypothetical protein
VVAALKALDRPDVASAGDALRWLVSSSRERGSAVHATNIAWGKNRGPGVLRPTPRAGDVHHQALRALGDRLVGILHGCLRHQQPYNEHTAWAHRQITQAA